MHKKKKAAPQPEADDEFLLKRKSPSKSPDRTDVRQPSDRRHKEKIDIQVKQPQQPNVVSPYDLGLENLTPDMLKAIRDRLVYQKLREEQIEKDELLDTKNLVRKKPRPQTASKAKKVPKKRINRKR